MDRGTKIIVWVVLAIVVIGVIYAVAKRMRSTQAYYNNNFELASEGFYYTNK